VSKKTVILIVAAVLVAFGVAKMMGTPGAGDELAATAMAAGDVEIVPASAFANTPLSARRAGARASDAGVSTCTWYKNGVQIAGVSEATLDPSNFGKGDEIVAEAVVEPGMPARRSHPVKIKGMRPQMNAATLLYDAEAAEIRAEAAASDVDGDALTYQYAWFRNNEKISGAEGATLKVSGFRNDDRIHVRVTAFDGEEASAPMNAAPVILGSDAPAITSMPPQAAEEGGRYVYQVATTAHDPGSLSFELSEAPAGMTIDENGRIEWPVPQDQEGAQSFNVTVRVLHTSGAETTQRFTIATAPRPVLTPAE
jgi:hypothetical protein